MHGAVTDPAYMVKSAASFLTPEYLAMRRAEISDTKANADAQVLNANTTDMLANLLIVRLASAAFPYRARPIADRPAAGWLGHCFLPGGRRGR